MAKASNQPLQPNPFMTYRDPLTGLWQVVKSATLSEEYNKLIPEPQLSSAKIESNHQSH